MLVKLTSCHLLHNDEHVLLRFISLLQLDYVLMVDHFHNGYFLAKELFLSICQSGLVDLFHGQKFTTVPILALVDCRELTIAQLSSLLVD